MIRRTFMVFTLVLAAIAWGAGAAAQHGDIEHWKRSTWRMTLNLDTPNLVPPAVQWAVLDKDPVPGFKARVKKMQGYHRKQLESAVGEAGKELVRSSQMTVCWDLGFKEVTGDKVYLLTSAPGVSHSLSSNAPDGNKWVVTKIVQIKGKPVCWCIPVEVKRGEEIEVTLTEDEVFDLEAVFDKTMREPSLFLES